MKSLQKYIFFAILLSYSLYGSKIAVATKVTGLVEIMPTGEKDFLKLKPGRVLSDGDKKELEVLVLRQSFSLMISQF